MPIKSYIIVPQAGKDDILAKQLAQLEGVEVHPSTNKEVMVVVTDTADEESDKDLVKQMEAIDELVHITLVSGFDEKAIQ